MKMFEKHRDIEREKGNKNMALVNTCLIMAFKELFNITDEDLK